jgi:dienelactone hydrolase
MTELRPFDYRDGDELFRGQIATPAGPGPHPAVLVMHDARGLGELARRRAVKLAEMGYVGLATDMYGAEAKYDLANPLDGGRLMLALHEEPEKLRGRVVAAFEALKAYPQVDASRIGALGFCFGGQCVLELARSGADVKSVVSFHGLLTSKLPAKQGAVKAKVLVMTGAKDPYAPLEHVDGFREEMTAAGAQWQVTIYSEGYHAFTDPKAADMGDVVPGVRYDPLLDKLSWAQAMAMLEATIG